MNKQAVFGVWVLLSLSCATAVAFTITKDDVLAGIASRNSKVRDIELLYSTAKEYKDGYYQSREDTMEQFSQSLDEQLRQIVLDLPPRKEANAYHMFQKGEWLAYELYSFSEDGSRQLEQKAVYKNGIQKFLNIPKQNGVIEPKRRDQFFPFRTLPELVGINNISLTSAINNPKISTHILGDHTEDGDLIVDLQLTLEVYHDPENKYGHGNDRTLTTWAVSLNTSKDFWPIKIAQSTSTFVGDELTGTYKGTECSCADFKGSAGVYYPALIDITTYYQKDATQTPVVSELHSIRVETVKVNSGLSDALFELDFPNGTFYHDVILGLGMTVGDATPLLGQQMREEIIGEPMTVNDLPSKASVPADHSRKVVPEVKVPAIESVETTIFEQPLPFKKNVRRSHWWVYLVAALSSLLIGLVLAILPARIRKRNANAKRI